MKSIYWTFKRFNEFVLGNHITFYLRIYNCNWDDVKLSEVMILFNCLPKDTVFRIILAEVMLKVSKENVHIFFLRAVWHQCVSTVTEDILHIHRVLYVNIVDKQMLVLIWFMLE